MRVTTNMGLTAAASSQDVYSWSTNAQNLYLLDYHDHSPGRGTRLTGASITPASLSGIHIGNGSLTGANISSTLQSINPSQVGIQVGMCSFNIISPSSEYSQAITYPIPYATTTDVMIFLSLANAPITNANYMVWSTNVTYTGFEAYLQTSTEQTITAEVNWMAVPKA